MRKKIVVVIILIIIISLGIWSGKKIFKSEPKEIYQVIVAVRDQQSADPVEDARSNLKVGDVILAKKGENNPWSDTERVSNLILKIELTESQAQELVASVTEKLSNAEKKSRLAEIKNAPRGEDAPMPTADEMDRYENDLDSQENVVLLRKYRINLDKIGFKLENINSGQSFDDKVFGWEIVSKK